MATKQQREERTRTLLMLSGIARENGHEISQTEISADLDTLHRYETTLHRIAENECNGWPRETVERRDGKTYRYSVTDAAWQARDERKETTIQGKVRELAGKYGLSVRFGGDPRGGSIRLIIPDGRSNGFVNDGTWGIYW